MIAAGATVLNIPDNYYADFDSRYDLAPERQTREVLPRIMPRMG